MTATMLSLMLAGTDWTAHFTGDSRVVRFGGAEVRMHMNGSNPSPSLSELPGRIRYSEVYDGIHLDYYRAGSSLEYDFVVAPGADPNRISMSFEGAGQTAIDGAGDLVLSTAAGELRQHAPVAFQWVDGRRKPVESRFIRRAGGAIGFALGSYDRSRPLVIDPVVSVSRLVGSAEADTSTGFAKDAAGNFYIGSVRQGATSPTITKLSPNGALIQSTVLTNFGSPNSVKVAVDGQQNIYFLGETFQSTCPANSTRIIGSVANPGMSLLIGKLAPNGVQLIYLTCVQLTGATFATGITVDGSGNAYIAGRSTSIVFPATSVHGTVVPGPTYGFVAKVSQDGTSFPFSIQIADATPSGVALDSALNVYVAGLAGSAFVTTNALFPTFRGGISDAFVMKVLASGLQIGYATFLGGSSKDNISGFAVNSQGRVAVTGFTESTDLGSGCAPVAPFTVGFVAMLAANGAALDYAKCLPATARVFNGASVVFDDGGDVLVTGIAQFAPNPPLPPLQPYGGGSTDGFVGRVNSNGTLTWMTYLGGSNSEQPFGILRTTEGFAVSGSTTSPDFPRTTADPLAGGADSFLTSYAERADLNLTKTTGFLSHSHLIRVQNFGPDPAAAVELNGSLAIGSYVTAPGCTVNGATFRCVFGTLPAGVFREVTVTTSGFLAGQLAASSTTFDPNPNNNSN